MLSHYEFEPSSDKDNGGSLARATSVRRLPFIPVLSALRDSHDIVKVTLHSEMTAVTDTMLSHSANRRYMLFKLTHSCLTFSVARSSAFTRLLFRSRTGTKDRDVHGQTLSSQPTSETQSARNQQPAVPPFRRMLNRFLSRPPPDLPPAPPLLISASSVAVLPVSAHTPTFPPMSPPALPTAVPSASIPPSSVEFPEFPLTRRLSNSVLPTPPPSKTSSPFGAATDIPPLSLQDL
jgi:hypothetical protein